MRICPFDVRLLWVGALVSLAAGLFYLLGAIRTAELLTGVLFLFTGVYLLALYRLHARPIAALTGFVEDSGDALTALREIWSDPAYLGMLRDEGVLPSFDLDSWCRSIRDAGPGPMIAHSPNVLLVDRDTFNRIETFSRDQLEKIGFFPIRGGERDQPGQLRPTCRWVVSSDAFPDPQESKSYPPPDVPHVSSSKGYLKAGVGPRHSMGDSVSNNCFGGGGNASDAAGWMIIASKVVCDPESDCTPRGVVKAISEYRSHVRADSGSNFCFGASTFGSALAADAVQFYVDGTLIPRGSGGVMATSGSAVTASLSLGVGGSASSTGGGSTTIGGPAGQPPGQSSTTTAGGSLSGNASVNISATKTREDGLAEDALNRWGEAQVLKPSMISELQSGGRTLADVHRKGAAMAEEFTSVAAMGQFGMETACGAGSFWAFRICAASGPNGDAGRESFRRRFDLLGSHFFGKQSPVDASGTRPPGNGVCYRNRDCHDPVIDNNCTYDECFWHDDAKSWKGSDGVCHNIR